MFALILIAVNETVTNGIAPNPPLWTTSILLFYTHHEATATGITKRSNGITGGGNNNSLLKM